MEILDNAPVDVAGRPADRFCAWIQAEWRTRRSHFVHDFARTVCHHGWIEGRLRVVSAPYHWRLMFPGFRFPVIAAAIGLLVCACSSSESNPQSAGGNGGEGGSSGAGGSGGSPDSGSSAASNACKISDCPKTGPFLSDTTCVTVLAGSCREVAKAFFDCRLANDKCNSSVKTKVNQQADSVAQINSGNGE